MTLSDQIQAWIDADGPYTQGVMLYRQSGGFQPMGYYEKYFNVPYIPPTKKAQLRKDLLKYLQRHPPSNAITITVNQADAKPKKPEAAPEEPEAIQALRRNAIPLHKRYSHLKAELYTAATADQPDQKKLYDIAREIMAETIPALDGIYDQIREWQRTGEVPDMPKPLVMQQSIDKMKKLASLRSRISNIRRFMRRGEFDEQQTMAYNQEIAEKQLQIAELLGELGLE